MPKKAKQSQQWIEDEFAVAAKAKSTSFRELASPFEEAFSGLSEEEMDRRVKAAKAARRKHSSSGRR